MYGAEGVHILELEPRTWCMLDKCLITKLHPWPRAICKQYALLYKGLEDLRGWASMAELYCSVPSLQFKNNQSWCMVNSEMVAAFAEH